MKKNETMSYADQIHMLNAVRGILWIFIGVLSCFESLVCTGLQILMLLICGGIIVRVAMAKREASDEMAQENLCRAKAIALDVMHGCFCIISIVAMILLRGKTAEVDWAKVIPAVFFMILGVEELIVGIAFRKLEDA